MTATPSTSGRSIVVGTDFSPGARNAIARALEIGRMNDATVEIVHAEPSLPRSILGETREHVREESEAIHAIAAEVRQAGVPVRLRVLGCGAVRGLRETARELGADLVVVGARGRMVPDAILGLTAERIASHARVPVLLVRRHASGEYRHALVAIDRRSDIRRALAVTRFVAPAADIGLVHAYEALHETTLMLHGATPASLMVYRRQARREARAALAERVAEAGIDDRHILLRHGNRRFVLEREARRPSNGLLVLERSRSAARRLFLGSTARAVIAHGTIDVLLL